MTTRQRKSEDLSRNPGMTPIDNPEPDLSDEKHEPDETTGRLPSQDRDRNTDTTTDNKRSVNDAGKTRRR
jgi:hypothetical protein